MKFLAFLTTLLLGSGVLVAAINYLLETVNEYLYPPVWVVWTHGLASEAEK